MSLNLSHVVPAAREEVWEWHTRPGALTRLAPRFLPMTPRTQAEKLSNGTTVFALPAGLKWVARHDLSNYRRGYRFTDVCTTAPIKALTNWRHVHEFADHPEGTLITDTVHSRLPSSALRPFFAFRQHQLIEDVSFLKRLGAYAAYTGITPVQPLRIALTGSRGTVGRALSAQLRTAGHTVIPLVRSTPKEEQRRWDPNYPDPQLLEGVDALIHLAGEPIYGRFNEAHKTAIRDSRVGPTRALAELVARSATVQTFISASAVGYYGPLRGEEELQEDSEPGEGFLAEVVRDWEAATEPARTAGTRVLNLRIGAVIAGNGGLLPLLKALFSTGLGGTFGDGNFWFSWIALDDLTDIIVRACLDTTLSGPLNAVAPNPVLNKEMVQALGKEMGRPTFLPIPTLGPAILLGKEGAQELALADQRALPGQLNAAGHQFRYPKLAAAFAHELGGEQPYCPPQEH